MTAEENPPPRRLAAGSPSETGPDQAPVALPAPLIATLDAPPTPGPEVPDDPRTGEPRVPWAVRVAGALSFLAVANVMAALLVVYAGAVDKLRFAEASWLMGQFVTEPGSLGRVLLSVSVTVIALLVAVPPALTGYYAWAGYRWTRVGALIGAASSFGVLTLNLWAWPTIAWAAAASALLWTPPAGRFFRAWHARRHPPEQFAPPVGGVYYGPLPRYRQD